MRKEIRICILLFLSLSILTGVVYPLMITTVGQLLFPRQANGSLIVKDGIIVGSKLIGQEFDNPRYFWGRLSATNPPYNASQSSGSNFGPMNPKLAEAAEGRLKKLSTTRGNAMRSVPVDLVTASSSGLDPHISMAAAQFQKSRVASARKRSEEEVQQFIDRFTTPRFLGLLGEPVVNVLELNLALDEVEK